MIVLEDYLSIFKPLLQAEDYEDVLAVVALRKNLRFTGGHPVAVAMKKENDSLRVKELVTYASKNALNVPLVLAVAEESHLYQSKCDVWIVGRGYRDQ